MSQGEPFGSTSIYAQYRVFKLAREHGVTVTLDGQGGDEVFAGYSGYPAHRLQSLVESGHWRTAGHFARHWADWPGRDRNSMLVEAAGRFAPRRWQGRILRRPPSPLLNIGVLRERGVETRFPLISLESSRKRRLVSQLRIAMTSVGLPSLLRHADRNSMRFSIESRVPFLDRELSELALSLPEKWLVDAEGTSKRIFRDAVRGWVPDAVIDRRDKIGFETPGQEWLEHLSSLPVDLAHPIPFLRQGRDNTVTGGLSETEIGWGGKSHWRLVNLRRWISLMGVDAS
jgi:asparagine synthase (glutamine-hydrolysing)